MKRWIMILIGAMMTITSILSQVHAGNNPAVDAALGATIEPLSPPIPAKKVFSKKVILIENAQDSTLSSLDISSESAAAEFEAELNHSSKRK